MVRRKIIHNRARCALCGDIIESKRTHDWVACSCGEIFVDGGYEYCRAGAKDFANFIGMYEHEGDAEAEESEVERDDRDK